VNKINNLKENMRQILGEAKAICPDELLDALLDWPLFQKSESLGLYMAMEDEVDLNSLLDLDKKTFLPAYDSVSKSYFMAEVEKTSDLCVGKFGILEPSVSCRKALANEVDLWLVPGRAFDDKGHRLGRGRGFYDRLLAGESGAKLGVPVDGFLVEDVPVDEWDVRMDYLLVKEGVRDVQSLLNKGL
jgi:5-formyltetrahydrofolate cyclo-ligase